MHFGELDNMHVHKWPAAPFDMKIDNKGYECDLEEMHVDLKAKELFKSKHISVYWSNINTATKYPKHRTVVEPFLLTFPISYMVEAGISHVNKIFTKQRNTLHLQISGNLRPKLKKFRLKIDNQAHPPH